MMRERSFQAGHERKSLMVEPLRDEIATIEIQLNFVMFSLAKDEGCVLWTGESIVDKERSFAVEFQDQ